MRAYLMALAAFTFFASVGADERSHKKRQIYREEVLPHAGGRIPDTAFETDRLFLNRLQKDGIAVPDGVVPEQRTPQVYPFYNKRTRAVFRIALSSDGRFTANEGKYRYQEVPTVDTTYLYPQIHGQQITLKPPGPVYPQHKQFLLHNLQLNQVKLQPKKKPQLLNISPSSNKGSAKSYKTESYQNFNIINTPVAPVGSKFSRDRFKGTTNDQKQYFSNSNYGGVSHLFNEFDDLFNNFDLHEPSNTFYEKSLGVYPSVSSPY